jgi:hypothetical protein
MRLKKDDLRVISIALDEMIKWNNLVKNYPDLKENLVKLRIATYEASEDGRRWRGTRKNTDLEVLKRYKYIKNIRTAANEFKKEK